MASLDFVLVILGARDVTVTNAGVMDMSIAGTFSLEQYGAVGDGVTSDQAAWTAAMAAITAAGGGTLILGAKTYLISGNAILPAGTTIVGQGVSSTLKTTSDAPVIKVQNARCALYNFRILGNLTGTSQTGVLVGDPAVANSCPVDFMANSVYATQLGAWGFVFNQNYLAFQGPDITACVADNCGAGGFWSYLAEYVTFANCQSVNHGAGGGSPIGFRVQAGNLMWTGGNITHCGLGVVVEDGGNAAHGIVVGASINHCGLPVKVNGTGGITAGMTFDSCHMYAGDIWLVTCSGITFRNCTIDVSDWIFQGSLGTVISSCKLPGVNPNAIIDSYLGATSSTVWDGNFDLSGQVPSFLSTRGLTQCDGETTLDMNNANATAAAATYSRETIKVSSTAAFTAGRTLTMPAPAADLYAYKKFVRNTQAGAFAVTLSTGAGTTQSIAQGKGAWMLFDTTGVVRLTADV